jgi:hypothetical protein
MSDYAISVKVRNGRIRRRIAECVFGSVSELCRKSGLHPERVGALLNLKLPPLMGNGRWRRSAAALAEVLGCTCEDLFSETQRTLALRDNHGESYITAAGLLKLFGRVERPLLDNPGEQLLEDADDQAKSVVIRRALDGLNLSARDRTIIESHFGIGCEERTLGDLALENHVSYDYVKSRVNRALSKLVTRRSLLQAYQPANAMGTADEARLRVARKRAAALRVEKKSEAHTPRTTHVSASVRDQVNSHSPQIGNRFCALSQ